MLYYQPVPQFLIVVEDLYYKCQYKYQYKCFFRDTTQVSEKGKVISGGLSKDDCGKLKCL